MLSLFELGVSACATRRFARSKRDAADAQVVLRDGFVWFRAVRGAK